MEYSRRPQTTFPPDSAHEAYREWITLEVIVHTPEYFSKFVSSSFATIQA